MATIVINVTNREDAADACREVANLIEQGYTNGLIGWSADSWEIDDSDSSENDN